VRVDRAEQAEPDRQAIVEDTSIPKIIGKLIRPALVGECP
jgi:hypothetical protein